MTIPYSVSEMEILLMAFILMVTLSALNLSGELINGRLLIYVTMCGLLTALAIITGMWVLAVVMGIPALVGLGKSIIRS